MSAAQKTQNSKFRACCFRCAKNMKQVNCTPDVQPRKGPAKITCFMLFVSRANQARKKHIPKGIYIAARLNLTPSRMGHVVCRPGEAHTDNAHSSRD
jgi:hypothetical protein